MLQVLAQQDSSDNRLHPFTNKDYSWNNAELGYDW